MASLNLNKDIHQTPQHAVLKKFVSSDAAISQAILDEFCKPVEHACHEHGKGEEVEQQLISSWQSILDLASAENTSDKQAGALADFLLDIQSRPDLQANGETCNTADGKIWQELPLFGRQVREVWNAAPEDDSDSSLSARWFSVNTFAAILLARTHSKSLSHPDLSLFALWTIRAALEDTQTPSNAALSAAAAWFAHAGTTMHQLSEQQKSFQGKIAKPGKLAEESQWTGYSSDRWKYWGQALASAQEKVDDEKTREVVQRALKAF